MVDIDLSLGVRPRLDLLTRDFGPWTGPRPPYRLPRVALFFRVIEREDGWACHQGRLELDRHHGLDNALRHLRDLATEWDSEAQLFVHRLDGTVTRVESGDS